MRPIRPRTDAAALALLMALSGCFNPMGSAGDTTGAATSEGSGSGTSQGSGSGPTDGTTEPTSTSTTAPPTTLPSQTEASVTSDPTLGTTTEPSTTTEPPPPDCGDLVVGPGEDCDDANDNNNDSCLNNCKAAQCGDGVVFEGVEACDDGSNNADDAPCTTMCQKAKCGDNVVCPGCKEECDGNLGCNIACKYSLRYVFVTSQVYRGDLLAGLAGADQLCMDLAAGNGGLQGRRFVAWLSTSTAHAADRVGASDYPFLRLDDAIIANNSGDLLDAAILAPINIDETKMPIAGVDQVWTGTEADGQVTSLNTLCADWTGGDMGRYGSASALTSQWTDAGLTDCVKEARLYCFQAGY
ncbi:hypothetical protein [Nannocystis radixulma]|uniref:Myxococcus cysteine-rich repeat-containing protein n=1 Tax=Nannocystis radixulma TaxID=2995305 RepID=A0ABT5B4W1_9BACT|nr:hypothetical protein [Nannocystis radixulma]MDC0668748.1 hypothetical protein [Nannocystis radixulma]